MEPGFRILDHPADIGIESWGPTFQEALSTAVMGLSSLLVDPATVGVTTRRPISVKAPDTESLVVKVLSEVLFLFDAERFVPKVLEVDAVSGTSLTGSIRGEPLDERKHVMRSDVKAVTYHQVSVDERPEGIFVTVYLDI